MREMPMCSFIRPLAMLPLVISGCAGPITNQVFLDDADFVSALPSEARHTVPFQAPEDPPPEAELAGLWSFTEEVTGAVNGHVLRMLELVDGIRALPPSERAEDWRRWGPWSLDRWSGTQLLVEMERSGLGEYSWQFLLGENPDWAPCLSGVHYAGATVSEGDGFFTFDGARLAEATGEGEAVQMEVDYDNREGTTLLVRFSGLDQGTGDASYWFESAEDGAGDFEFSNEADLVDGSMPEDLEIRSRWLGDAGGRGDARVAGGDLASEVVTLTQCWDVDGALTYQEGSHDTFETMGAAELCPFSDAAWPEHL